MGGGTGGTGGTEKYREYMIYLLTFIIFCRATRATGTTPHKPSPTAKIMGAMCPLDPYGKKRSPGFLPQKARFWG